MRMRPAERERIASGEGEQEERGDGERSAALRHAGFLSCDRMRSRSAVGIGSTIGYRRMPSHPLDG